MLNTILTGFLVLIAGLLLWLGYTFPNVAWAELAKGLAVVTSLLAVKQLQDRDASRI